MGVETERKFLVHAPDLDGAARSVHMRQAYLVASEELSVRVRLTGEKAWLTIKGQGRSLSRPEFEYAIPLEDAEDIFDTLCDGHPIDKTRYYFPAGDHTWELDVFHGVNEGLVLAEVELQSEDEDFEKPSWLGEEVSGDSRYFNAWLFKQPFTTWPA